MPSQTDVFSVSRLNSEVRQLLEQGFGRVQLLGEISNFAAPASGHWYFTLKDERAQVKAAMFRGNNQQVRIRPQNGMQVLVRARLTLYEPRGDYQLVVEHMEDAGAGLLQQQFEQLKHQLAEQGLFANEHKKSLPDHIQRVGIITSPSGAAIRDMLAVLKRRAPGVEVIIYPSAVQGEAATKELRAMLQKAIDRNEVDVLVLTRGGGSMEDLWCFNDEQLAQMLYHCPLPVISAVGHEIDFTIADFVADVRAPTPSAAAELISRDQLHDKQLLQQHYNRAQQAVVQQLRQARRQFEFLHKRLQQQHPERQLGLTQQRLDELQMRMHRAIKQRLRDAEQRLELSQHGLAQLHPKRGLVRAQEQLEQLRARADKAIENNLERRQQHFARQAQALQLVSPLNTVARGYAIVQNANGDVIRRVEQTQLGEPLQVRLGDGEISVERRR